MLHRGEIVEKTIRESGYSITSIAQKIGKSRRWMYLLFENTAVSIELILQIGKIIYQGKVFFLPKRDLLFNGMPFIFRFVCYFFPLYDFWKIQIKIMLEEYNALLKQELGKK